LSFAWNVHWLAENKTTDVVEQQPITAIHDDVLPETTPLVSAIPFHKALLTNVSDGSDHDLKSFLQRPVVVYSSSWSTSQGTGTLITSLPAPQTLLQSIPMVSQKISGFLGLRSKIVCRLQVNATRFQQGRLLLMFFPQSDVMSVKYAQCLDSPMNFTQLPRVDFDAASDTEVILEIPYISPYLAYNTVSGLGGMGTFNLLVYSPLTVATSETTAEITMWMHMEDIELYFPTVPNPTYVPQAGGRMRRRLKFGHDVEEEEAQVSSGPISSTLGTISTVADALGNIPALSSIARPAAWATNIMAKTASAFGFSSPLNQDRAVVAAQKQLIGSTNCDYADNSHALGVSASNHIEHLPGFAGVDKDEMSFAHILSIPTWYETVAWADSVQPLNSLFNISVGPRVFRTSFSYGPDTCSYNTPVGYVSNWFKYYRGSFTFHFKFVKTEFHSGRLQFSFLPGYSGTPPTLTDANCAFIHKEIVDIRYTTEFKITCPWVSTTPWLDCNTTYGNLSVNVINELRHPDTVPSTIQLIVEVSCSPDFEFSVPYNPKLYPWIHNPAVVIPAAPSVSIPVESAAAQSIKVEAQIGEDSTGHIESSAVPLPSPSSIGTTSITSDFMSSSRYTIGESICSLRQLLKRSTLINLTNQTDFGNFLLTQPWALLAGYNTTAGIIYGYFTNIGTNQVSGVQDYLSAFAPCYQLMRGSIRLKLLNYLQPIEVMKASLVVYELPADNSTTSMQYADFAQLYSTTGFSTDHPNLIEYSPIAAPAGINPNLEVSVPFYSQFQSVYTYSDAERLNPAKTTNYSPTELPAKVVFTSPNTQVIDTCGILRRVGDDFSLGFWTGALALTDGTRNPLLTTQLW